MARKDFYQVENVPVMELMLDHLNARIRSAKDQAECMSRLLRKEDQLVALAKNIAEEGLSTVPVLISKNADGKWVVMDGNRRVAALKLLNNPDLCSIERPRRQLAAIRAKYLDNIPSEVDCLASDSPEAIIKEILVRHSGTLGGVGQLDWTTYWRTAFMLQHRQSDPNRRVGQYLFWAEEQGIAIDDEFPVTNLVRFINEGNLGQLGFAVVDDSLVSIIDNGLCHRMAGKIISDFGPGKKSVNSVYSSEQQKAYLTEVREFAGLDPHEPDINSKPDPDIDVKGGAADSPSAGGTENGRGAKGGNSSDGGDPDGARAGEGESREEGRGNGDAKGGGSRPKPSWDRPKLFYRGIFPGKIPASETKALSVAADLCKLETGKTTMAVAVLLRVFIEMSEAHYRVKNGLVDKQALRMNVGRSARKMAEDGILNANQLEVIDRRTKTTDDMLSINTLQSFVHTSTFHPDRQALHTLWDDVHPFVVACWAPSISDF